MKQWQAAAGDAAAARGLQLLKLSSRAQLGQQLPAVGGRGCAGEGGAEARPDEGRPSLPHDGGSWGPGSSGDQDDGSDDGDHGDKQAQH